MTDRLIRITTALAVATVAAVAAVISYRHAYELVSTHGETGVTARLVPFTVDGLILAASMLILDANRRSQPVPPLARWCLAAGILATIGANLAHGLGLVSSAHWSAPGPRPNRRLRTPHDPHQDRAAYQHPVRLSGADEPPSARTKRRHATDDHGSTRPGANDTGVAPGRS